MDDFDFHDNDDCREEPTAERVAIHAFMKSEDGRKFVYGFLQSCGVFDNNFNADPIMHAYNAGKRQSGLYFENEIKNAAPVEYVKMIKGELE